MFKTKLLTALSCLLIAGALPGIAIAAPTDDQYGGTTVQAEIEGGSPNDGSGSSSTAGGGGSSSGGGSGTSSGTTFGLPVTGLDLAGFLVVGLAIVGTGVAIRKLSVAERPQV